MPAHNLPHGYVLQNQSIILLTYHKISEALNPLNLCSPSPYSSLFVFYIPSMDYYPYYSHPSLYLTSYNAVMFFHLVLIYAHSKTVFP